MSEARPRLVIVTESKESWGAERSLLRILNSGVARRFDVTLVVSEKSPLPAQWSEHGFKFVRHRFAKHAALEAHGSLAGAGASELAREITQMVSGGARLAFKLRRADLVLSFSLWQLPETKLAARLSRTKLAVDLHETFRNAQVAKILPYLIGKRTLLLAPSQYVVNRSGLRNHRQKRVIPRPVEAPSSDAPVASVAPLSVRTIGIFGQITPHKRVLEAVEALNGLNIRILVVGGRAREARTAYETRVREVVDAHGYGSEVLEKVENPYALMATCDFVLNASAHEAFGRTVVEAAALGAIPLVLDESGPAECARDLGCGIILSSLANGRPMMERMVSASDATLDQFRLKDTRLLERFAAENVGAAYSTALWRYLMNRTPVET